MSRQKHREEVLKLRQELQSIQSTSKGGQQATDRTKKDLEKTRCAIPTPCIPVILKLPLAFFQPYTVVMSIISSGLTALYLQRDQCLQAAMLAITARIRAACHTVKLNC